MQHLTGCMAHSTLPKPSAPYSAPRGLFSITKTRPLPKRHLQHCTAANTNTNSALAATDDGWFSTEVGQKEWVEAMELNTEELPQLLIELGVRYDPDRLAAALSARTVEINARAVKVAVVLGGFVTKLLRDYALGQLDSKSEKRAKQLRKLLASLGPSFVKVGQALSARPDLLPKPYLDSLAELQDRLPSFPTAIAYTVIEEELGRPIEEVYSELSAEPVAAASLGQVYKGILRSTGEAVAVKVQRPGIGENIAIDMLLLRRLVAMVDANVPQIKQPLVPLVDEFASRLFSELDYVQEGKNCERFQELYGSVPRVRTPTIKWEATSRRVLTMQWIEGVKLTDNAAMNAAGLNIVDFVDIGVECTLRQLLEHGLFHADPHPGNLLATQDENGNLYLTYLDFGMMSEAPLYARYAIISHVVHLVNRDYLAMCRDYYTLQFMDPAVDTRPIAPALALFFDDVLDNSVSKLNFKAIVDGLGAVLFEYPFRVPAYYALILRSLTVLEGLALTADSDYKLLGKAYPYMAKRLLLDPAPELRQSFEELVLQEGRLRWSRMENLLREGSKSSDFNAQDLWLLAEWILSDGGAAVRGPLVSEVVRLFDAKLSEAVRLQVRERFGDRMAQMLVPEVPGEADSRARFDLLVRTMSGSTASTSTTTVTSTVVAATSGSNGVSVVEVVDTGAPYAVPVSNRAPLGVPLMGTGPFGLPTPADIQSWVAEYQWHAETTIPRLQALSQRPAAVEFGAQLQQGLLQRFAARSVKFLAGSHTAISNGRQDDQAATAQVSDDGRGKFGPTAPQGPLSGPARPVNGEVVVVNDAVVMRST